MAAPKVGDTIWVRPGATEGIHCGPVYALDHGGQPGNPVPALVCAVRPDTGPNDPAVLNVACFDMNGLHRPLGSVPFYDTGMRKPDLGSMTFGEWPS